jgi:hypothetical protein
MKPNEVLIPRMMPDPVTSEVTNAQISELIAEVVPRGLVVGSMAVQQLRPLLAELLELRAKLAERDELLREAMPYLQCYSECGCSRNALFVRIKTLLTAAPYGEDKP